MIPGAGRAPIVRPISLPPANSDIVGIDRILKRPARSCSSSVFTLTTTSRPASLEATRAISGATARHGPHHGAQKSTSTGTGDAFTSASKDDVDETSTGVSSFGNSL